MTIRVIERDDSILVQKRKFLIWVTLYKTRNPTDALLYLRAINVEYNKQTGYYE